MYHGDASPTDKKFKLISVFAHKRPKRATSKPSVGKQGNEEEEDGISSSSEEEQSDDEDGYDDQDTELLAKKAPFYSVILAAPPPSWNIPRWKIVSCSFFD